MYTNFFTQIISTQSPTYSLSPAKILTVYANTGVKDFCRDNHIDLEGYNYPTVVDSTVEDCSFLLEGCESFNNVLVLPDTIKNCIGALKGCASFNSEITVPKNAIYKDNMFEGCMSLELYNINPYNPVVYSITQFDETRFYKSDLRTLAELIDIYVSAEQKYGTLMEVNGSTQIDEGYFVEIQQKKGSESCEFDMDRNIITAITKEDFLKVIRNTNVLTVQQILELIY